MLMIIWVAILLSIISYPVICFAPLTMEPLIEDNGMIKGLFIGLSAMALAMAWFIRHVMLKRKSNGPANPEMPEPLVRYRNATIIALSLCEIIALNGLLVWVLTADQLAALALIPFSIVGMVLFLPKTHDQESLLEDCSTD